MTIKHPVEPGMSAASVNVITALLEARTGQQVSTYRSWRVDVAPKPLLRARKLDTLDQLVTLLLDGSDLGIGDRIVEALVNQETSLFRDAPVFDAVAAAVAAAEAGGRRARIWSAGCATGQEPLSLAMLFAERQEATGAPMPEIVASDLGEAALTRARSGRYSQFEIQRGLPIRRLMRWFDSVNDEWAAKPELLRMIAFRRVNLVSDPPPPGRFDVALCRNVLLYLSPEAKTRVFGRFADVLRPDGQLVLGAGETTIGQTDRFTPSPGHRGFYTVAERRDDSRAA